MAMVPMVLRVGIWEEHKSKQENKEDVNKTYMG
jgi:hypothetical protein